MASQRRAASMNAMAARNRGAARSSASQRR
uniref:Uncharacterized protein n=1 Tax=Arundo donax TaxID=35708 RepID=A0A0A9AYK1_ARUDO